MNCVQARELAAGAWLFEIEPVRDNGLAVSTSTNGVYVVDGETLQTRHVIGKAHDDVITGLSSSADGRELISVGRDCMLKVWDSRSSKASPVRSYRAPAGILSVSAHRVNDRIAIGTELKGTDAWVNVYDTRGGEPVVSYSDSHSEDVTSLYWHPSTDLLLSGGGDSIVNLFDTQVSDEDDAVLQVFNHGASVHIAQFVGKNEVLAVSHMETASLYRLTYASEQEPRDEVREYGDLRERLSTDYVISLDSGPTPRLYCASNAGTLSMIPFDTNDLSFDVDKRVDADAGTTEVIRSAYRLSNALEHGDEVVYTAGEDGMLRVFAKSTVVRTDEEKLQRKRERRESKLAERKERKRYEPY
ncbi:hypothetical protein PYCC9005_004533 [Savitreella phatthalungensis]